MNKLNKFLYFFLPMMILVGCADLDLQPTNMIGEDAVKNDPKLVELASFWLKLGMSQGFWGSASLFPGPLSVRQMHSWGDL